MRSDAIAARREQVAALLMARRSQREIAKSLNTPLTTIHRDIEALRMEWRADRMVAADQVISEELQRLAFAEKAIMPAVSRGDLMAIDRLLRVMERRAKLLGLDAPKRYEITDSIRRLAEESGLDPDEMVREAEQIMRSFS